MDSSNTTTMQVSLSKVGLGYGIAIAVGILVLISTIMLASYVCVRVHQTSSGSSHSGTNSTVPPHHSGRGDDGSGTGPFGEWSTGGLDQITVESYPKVVYSSSQPLPHLQDTSCSICLGDYKDGDMLRMLPECRHMFHAPCIDAWLRLHASCPICRTSPLPSPLATPISTPLSELIPLARHPLGIRSHS
ncbi:hypothetical protein M758_1G219300 [Ceratodon purpureus]|uniref:RING-type domain-containing protein n=1 Tax=Ceratodon purpureus TaxID=3225 RepID=A0A8T0J8C7_CERPU|nr:hypothetical protein KC19_1G200200 [Ceratodon purpureus]KAG0630996.1 hypothetical protein M758_1G219300 [Ceratodon purpureus]